MVEPIMPAGQSDLPPSDTGCHEAGPDDLLAAALAGGAEVAEAARQAGCSARTAYRRLADPQFRRRVAELRGRAVEQSLGKVTGVLTVAADKLRGLLGSDDERVRLSAVKLVFEVESRLRELVDIDVQV